jgi:hypothetical protein
MAGYPKDLKLDIDVRAIVEVVTRIDKRTAYYNYFHNGTKIHESKRLGALIYWILKFKPLRVIDERFKNGDISKLEEAFRLNESFVLSIIYSTLLNEGKIKTTPAKNSELHKSLLYTLKYREVSQDAIMALIYSLYNILDISQGIPDIDIDD